MSAAANGRVGSRVPRGSGEGWRLLLPQQRLADKQKVHREGAHIKCLVADNAAPRLLRGPPPPVLVVEESSSLSFAGGERVKTDYNLPVL